MGETNMSISVNGQSQVPPGFRFHPTEEELLHYYLKKKVSNLRIDLDVIRDIDLNKLEPWDIQEKCRIGTTPQSDWYLFSHKDKKYPTGTRTNRATAAGFWKATGRDKSIFVNGRRIGMRKTLVFYKGRAPHGQKSEWIMHEYRLDESTPNIQSSVPVIDQSTQEEGWVVCRIFKKKSHHKNRHVDHESPPMISSLASPSNEIISIFDDSTNDNQEGALEQIFQCMKRNHCKQETTINGLISNDNHQTLMNHSLLSSDHHDHDQMEMMSNWTALDRFVASQLNDDQVSREALRSSSSSSSFNNMIKTGDIYDAATQEYSNETELWSFARSSSSYSSSARIRHVSNGLLK